MLLSRFEQLIALLSQKEVDAFFVTVLNEVSESTQPLRMFALEVQEFLENRPEGVKMVTFLGLPRRKASYASNLLSDLLELLQLYFVRLEARDNLNENFIHLLGKRDAPPSLYLKFWKKANSDNANRPISLNKLKVDYELKAQLYDYSSTI
ncbi:MAG TPA: hypothetical protein ENJ82_04540, partial [Bacteroidetes bacterium]|nr:hypothetical protein [Bacteroidota bacterium]